MRYLVLGIMLAAFTCTGIAADKSDASKKYPKQISKGKFIATLQAQLPAALCKKDTYFSACYKLDENRCQIAVRFMTIGCASAYYPNMPKTLKMPTDVSKWGSDIGRCAGSAFGMTFRKIKKTDAECASPQAWMKKNKPAK